jgi:hypothetical protein
MAVVWPRERNRERFSASFVLSRDRGTARGGFSFLLFLFTSHGT